MNYKKDMELAYKFFTENSPEVKNPKLDRSSPHVEQRVSCVCFKSYRVYVNGNTPISDTIMDGVFCPHCGTDAKNCYSVSGHSAGCFNMSFIKYH